MTLGGCIVRREAHRRDLGTNAGGGPGACNEGVAASPSCVRPPFEAASGLSWKEAGAVAQYEGYCMKCRQKRQFEGQIVTLKNGRPAAQGACPVCGTKLTRILSKAEAGN